MSELKRITEKIEDYTEVEQDEPKLLTRDKQYALANIIQTARREIEDRPDIKGAIGAAGDIYESMAICLNELPADGEVRSAIDTLVLSQLRLAHKLAVASMGIIKVPTYDARLGNIGNLQHPDGVLDDRVQLARLTLIEAAWGYDPFRHDGSQPFTFGKHASLKIHARLYEYVVGSSERSIIRFSDGTARSMGERATQLNKLSSKERAITLQFLRLRDAKAIIKLGSLGDGLEYASSSVEEVSEAELRDGIWQMLGQLDDRSQKVLIALFGLDGRPPQLGKDIAKTFGVTNTTITNIQKAALKKMRRSDMAEYLRDHLNSSPGSIS